MQHSAHLVQVDDLHAACVSSVTDKAKQAVNHCVSSRDQLLFEALAADLIQAWNSKKTMQLQQGSTIAMSSALLNTSVVLFYKAGYCWEQHLTGADTVCADQLDGLLCCPQPLHLSIEHGQVGHLQTSSSCARKCTIHQQQAITCHITSQIASKGLSNSKPVPCLPAAKLLACPAGSICNKCKKGSNSAASCCGALELACRMPSSSCK